MHLNLASAVVAFDVGCVELQKFLSVNAFNMVWVAYTLEVL